MHGWLGGEWAGRLHDDAPWRRRRHREAAELVVPVRNCNSRLRVLWVDSPREVGTLERLAHFDDVRVAVGRRLHVLLLLLLLRVSVDYHPLARLEKLSVEAADVVAVEQHRRVRRAADGRCRRQRHTQWRRIMLARGCRRRVVGAPVDKRQQLRAARRRLRPIAERRSVEALSRHIVLICPRRVLMRVAR